MMNKKPSVDLVRDWVENFVIRWNLCPFAKEPFTKGTIRFIPFSGTDLHDLLMTIQQELIFLQKTPAEEVETTIIIAENTLLEFSVYLDFLDIVQDLIFALRMDGVFQVASFHPDYQFADTDYEDVTNFTNRSPFPLLHLLREESISRGLHFYEKPEHIPLHNQATMRKIFGKNGEHSR